MVYRSIEPNQASLFNDQEEHIHLPDADILLLRGWLSLLDGNQLLAQLHNKADWQQSQILLAGKSVLIPRLNAWYGDSNCGYQYSGCYFEPKPWFTELSQLKQAVEECLKEYLQGRQFNSVLLNYYRNGQDGVAWHSDDELELGKNPLVASLSLGAERLFQLRHKKQLHVEKYQLALAHGDLLLMYGPMQHHWQHQIPKTKKPVGGRVNLTFRIINHIVTES